MDWGLARVLGQADNRDLRIKPIKTTQMRTHDQIVFGRGSRVSSSYMSSFSLKKPTSPWILAHSIVGKR